MDFSGYLWLMTSPYETTYSAPRFMAFIDLGYLLVAIKAADEHLEKRLPETHEDESQHVIGNVNATRQSLLRAAFIAAYGIFEQNLDELVNMDQKSGGHLIAPSDLKDRGITRSLTYARKVLGMSIDTSANHWKDVLLLQEVRNHLTHFGPEFADSGDHAKRWEKFKRSELVSLRPMICFTIDQFEEICHRFTSCIEDFT